MLVGLVSGSVGGGSLSVSCSMGEPQYGRFFEIVEVAALLLFIFVFYVRTRGSDSRGMGIAVGEDGARLRGILGSVRGRASCLFVCGGFIGISEGISIGLGGTSLRRILTGLFTKASIGCSISNSCVLLSTNKAAAAVSLSTRRNGVIDNIVASVGNRPVVNTGIVRGSSRSIKAIASISNGFALTLSGPTTALIISCVNCLAGRIPMNDRSILGVVLSRSARGLRRIIIVNCNSMGGDSLANTINSVRMSGIRNVDIGSMSRVLRKHASNLCVMRGSKVPNTDSAIHVHNNGSVSNNGRPLCVVSNVPICPDTSTDRATLDPLGSVPASSVRSVRILGSTSSATVCNSHNTGNIVVMAAGGNGDNGASITFSTC